MVGGHSAGVVWQDHATGVGHHCGGHPGHSAGVGISFKNCEFDDPGVEGEPVSHSQWFAYAM